MLVPHFTAKAKGAREMSEEKILPCPHCGFEASLDNSAGAWFINCPMADCGNLGFVDDENYEPDEIIKKWNKRES